MDEEQLRKELVSTIDRLNDAIESCVEDRVLPTLTNSKINAIRQLNGMDEGKEAEEIAEAMMRIVEEVLEVRAGLSAAAARARVLEIVLRIIGVED